MGTAERTEAVPELRTELPRASRWVGLLRDRQSPHYKEEAKFCEQLRVPECLGLDAVPWETVLGEGLTVMFGHGGVCPCGRRTYVWAVH